MTDIENYILEFPEDVQQKMRQIDALIKERAPNATSYISCGMPTYKINGKPLIYFAGFKLHIGL